MQLPQLNAKADSYVPLNQFGGLNLNPVVNDGEWSDLTNITNDSFPILTPRAKRGIVTKLDAPQGILGGDKIAWVDSDKLYYNMTYVCDLNSTITKSNPSGTERKLCAMGSYIVVFPDGIVYDTESGTSTTIKNTVTVSDVEITLCKATGTAYKSAKTVVSDEEPSNKTYYWVDTSSDPVVMKIYNSNTSSWTSVGTTYVKFAATGIGKGFSAYDSAMFSGVDTSSDDDGDSQWIYNDYDFNQENIIYKRSANYVVVAGLINKTHTNSTAITIERRLPEMDFVCEMDNRIWGCSSANHEIYACKQGDPHNWYRYAGLTDDSYAATVGTMGDFTGIASYGGYMYFFKEAGYHKLYGTKPSNYEMVWKPGHGVQKGSGKSIEGLNEILVLKGKDGFYGFDGSMESINANLGTKTFYDAIGSSFQNKYYVCVRDSDYQYKTLVYDTTKGMWSAEDDTKIKYMACCGDGIYMIDENGNVTVTNTQQIKAKIFPQETQFGDTYLYPNDAFYPGDVIGGNMEDDVEWSATTGDIDLGSAMHKYLKRIIFRIWLDTNSKLKVEVQYDSSGDWIELIEYYATRKRSYEIPVPVQRCDHMKIRLSGSGDFKLFSMTKVVEEGSATR